jgi:hypothetical protein
LAAGARRPTTGHDHVPAVMSAVNSTAGGGAARTEVAAQPTSAAAPSPFTPIADYAFLPDCHTGALVAPGGGIDWFCVPRFDAPRVFGMLLDREAGSFRLGPFRINVPAARAYDPGTNILVTTWRTPSGWIVVRDALTMGPRRTEDTVTPHTRPPADRRRRRDRRRASGQRGNLHHLLVLARLGAHDRRRDPAGPRPEGAPAARGLAARALRRGVRRRHQPASRQLPAGLLAPGADRGRRGIIIAETLEAVGA